MSRVLEATCEAGVVTVEGLVLEDAVILSEGVASSEGIVIIQGGAAYYVASRALDLKEVIESLVEIITQIATIASGLDAVTVTPGSNAAAIAMLTTMKTQFELKKDNLR